MPAYSRAFAQSLRDLDSAIADLRPDRLSVDSWRADAYDPAWDDPDTAPANPRRQIEVVPGVWMTPDYFDRFTGRKPRPGAWQIKEEEYDDLGLEDWA